MNVLLFILPELDRTRLVYWNTKQAKESYIDTEKLFNSSDTEGSDNESDSDGDFTCRTRLTMHRLPVDNEFLLTCMKLRMVLSNIDLEERFHIAEGSVTNIFLTWINYLYLTLGTLKVWPHTGP